jgi:hypothetical protein
MTAEDFINAKATLINGKKELNFVDGENSFLIENDLGEFGFIFYLNIDLENDVFDIDSIGGELIYYDNDKEPKFDLSDKQVEQWIGKQRNF